MLNKKPYVVVMLPKVHLSHVPERIRVFADDVTMLYEHEAVINYSNEHGFVDFSINPRYNTEEVMKDFEKVLDMTIAVNHSLDEES